MPLPISLSSLACFILPAHILKAEGQGLFNMYLEFLIRRLPSKLIISIRESKFAAAIIFSALHSCIMFGFLKKSSKNFWFSSFKIRDETSLNKKDSKCERIHGQLTCFRYLSQVIKNLPCEPSALEVVNNQINLFLQQTGTETVGEICIWTCLLQTAARSFLFSS